MKMAVSVGAAALVAAAAAAGENRNCLHYGSPAKNWTEAVPLGNGRLGAMPFGGVKQERLLCNEISLWSGWAEEENDRPGSFEALQKVRQLIREGKCVEAGKTAVSDFLSDKGYGKRDFGAYQSFCDVSIDFDGIPEKVDEYRRDLDITSATAHVSFRAAGTKYCREYFCSYPDQVTVMRLTAEKKGLLTFKVGTTSLHKHHKVTANGNELVMAGQVDTGSPDHEGMRFESRLKVIAVGGKVVADADKLSVTGADSAVILLSCATNYRQKYPSYVGESPGDRNLRILKAAEAKSYDQLLDAHIADYRRLFDRVTLELEGHSPDAQPTDARLQEYKKSKDDRGLEALLFQYGRYLLISSSRPGSLPANLQGLWNDSNTPPWQCDYHLNINLEMNYWPAGPANLSECTEPLIKWLEDIRKPGETTAKVHYNSKGWVVHHVANIWGFTAPGSARGVHMLEAESAAFICQNVWDYYEFTQDKEWLKNVGWPILKGAAEFWVDNLQEMPGGYLAVSPSYSPEHGPLTQGASYQVMIIRDLFTHCVRAGGILQSDKEFCEQLRKLLDRLLPLRIGKFGQLCEWMDDDLEKHVQTDHHRHVSHMYSVYPGNQVNTPELKAAAIQTMNYRGDEAPGWGIGWRISIWARLQDGDRAHKLVEGLLSEHVAENLWDLGPPFQIDGNFGYTSGICEMLVQSHHVASSGGKLAGKEEYQIDLLPALPKAWASGRVRGLRARGAFTVDMEWKDGKVTGFRISSKEPSPITVRVNGKLQTVTPDKAVSQL